MKQHELFSYLYDFISQLLDHQEIFIAVRRIIFFGSVVRGDFSKNSDLDLFIDLHSPSDQKKIQELLKREIDKFELRCERTWLLRGINLPIKVLVGDLQQERWKELREEILNYGKTVYGRFEQKPEQLEPKALIQYHLKKLSAKDKMSFLRELYGYATLKGRKKYLQKGLIQEIKGEKIGPNVLLVDSENIVKVRKLCQEYNLDCLVREVWSR